MLGTNLGTIIVVDKKGHRFQFNESCIVVKTLLIYTILTKYLNVLLLLFLHVLIRNNAFNITKFKLYEKHIKKL